MLTSNVWHVPGADVDLIVDTANGTVHALPGDLPEGELQVVPSPDGTKAVSSYRRPHTLYLMEAFKIKAGKIARIEAVFTTVPYKMPYPAGK